MGGKACSVVEWARALWHATSYHIAFPGLLREAVAVATIAHARADATARQATEEISMKPSRLLGCMALMLAAALPLSTARAADWKPTSDVEFVIPYGLGGGADLLARVIIKIMTEEKLVPV